MKTPKVVLAVAVVIAIVGSYMFPTVPQQIRQEVQKQVETALNTLGSVVGPDMYSFFNVHGVFSQGGGVYSTSTVQTTATLLARDMADFNVVDFNPLTGNSTLTLPATTTFPLLNEAGATRSWVLRNSTSTAAITVTVAAGTGIDLQEPDGQNVVVASTNFAWITCYRKIDTDIVCLIDESIPAD